MSAKEKKQLLLETRNELEKMYLKKSNRKIAQKIKLLKINQQFNQDINCLQKKWTKLIKKNNNLSNELVISYKKLSQKYWKKYNLKPTAPHIFTKILHKINKKECHDFLKKFGAILRNNSNRQLKIVSNKYFDEDCTILCKKYKLFPITNWFIVIHNYILNNYFLSPLFHYDPIFNEKKIDKLGLDANFNIEILTDPLSNEEQVHIIPFENTTIADIKKYWKKVTEINKILYHKKGIDKRYYPLKNLNIANQLFNLDKIEKSDWIKQEKIYGEITDENFAKKEKLRKNRLKQIRYSYKKRIS